MVKSLTGREALIQLLKFHLQRAKDRMKIMIEKHKTERVFATYDLVLLKLQTYMQSTLWQHKHHKLSPKYYGPYKVVARIGQVAYKLELPVNSQIHLVFHESQFKFKGDAPHMPARNAAKVYVLMQWINEGPDDATWELYDDIAARFLNFDLNA
ncbi:hypothetical protein Tco_0488220 [Tanacetum coccineum]